MKRNVICIFSLVLWCLLGCTVLSEKIEEQMTVSNVAVELEETYLEGGVVQMTLPGDCLISDENGLHLYRTEKGEGWDTGNRLREIEPEMYWYDEEQNMIIYPSGYAGDRFVRYVSRPVSEGELAQTCYPRAGGEDCYLVVNPGDVDPSLETWETASVTEEREGMLLVTLNGKQPFLESQARSELGFARDTRVYSLGDIRNFFGSFPLLAGIAAVFLGTVLLWGYSLMLVKDLQKNRWRLLAHGVTGAVLFGIFTMLVERIQLPSSLLPPDNILNMEYYAEEFGVAFRELEKFSADAAQETLRAFSVNAALAGGVILGGAALILVVIFLEKRGVERVETGSSSKKEGKPL